jgi:Rieske 2Fe-2S family protein
LRKNWVNQTGLVGHNELSPRPVAALTDFCAALATDVTMSSLTLDEERSLSELIDRREANHTLPGDFYSSDLVYRAELDRIWRRGWLLAGHTCEIPAPGDYFTFAVDADSLIVMRDDDGQINALWNVCRHRGTELCDQPSGKVGRLVCPYHQWTYGRDGALLSCRGMQSELDKSELGLLRAPVRELGGLIYVSLSDSPPDFEGAVEAIGPLLTPQGFDRAKIAKTVDYEVAANWKIVWENNRECYHCNVNHPRCSGQSWP